MTDGGPTRGAGRIRSVEEYERKLSASMRLMSRDTRESILREIMAGVEEQVRVSGGDFPRVAPSLDDPAWVGAQMVKVYGISTNSKVLVLSMAALLALMSAPGVFVDEGTATVLGLFGIALLLLTIYRAADLFSAGFALLIACVAAAVRIAFFLIPLRDAAPLDSASGADAALFLVATALLVVVAVLPAFASRRGAHGP